jgi:ribosomal protein S18 acetylase RimI-like enzyme
MKQEEVSRGPNIMIRPMTPADLDDVMRIEEVSYTVPWKRTMFEVELNSNPFARLFTARNADLSIPGGALLGYVCFWMVFDELHLMNLSVHPDRRRMGIGEELAQWVLAWARENWRSGPRTRPRDGCTRSWDSKWLRRGGAITVNRRKMP